MFQKSSENITCGVYDEMSRLVRLYASNFLKREVILAAGDKLRGKHFPKDNVQEERMLSSLLFAQFIKPITDQQIAFPSCLLYVLNNFSQEVFIIVLEEIVKGFCFGVTVGLQVMKLHSA